MLQLQRKPPLQIRLIEAGKRHTRIHRNKQRVEILAAIVLIFIPGNRLTRRRSVTDKRNRRHVVSRHHRQQQMPIHLIGRDRLPIDRRRLNRPIAVIHRQLPRRLALERHRLGARNRRRMLLDRERQLIMQIRNPPRPRNRQLMRYPGFNGSGHCVRSQSSACDSNHNPSSK